MLVPTLSRKKHLGTSALRAHNNLMGGGSPAVWSYLTEQRGLTEETIRRFGLGVIPDDDPDYESERGWVTIPYITPGGYVDLRFRRPPDSTHPAKYKSQPNSQQRIFNTLPVVEGGDTLAITEGEFDCMILTQCGVPAIALPGATAWSPVFALTIQGFDNILICEDGDDEGAGAKLSQNILKDIDWAKIVRFPGHDVNSFYLEHGAAELVEHVLGQLRKEEDSDSDKHTGTVSFDETDWTIPPSGH